MSSIIAKTLPVIQKFTILLLSTMLIVACGGGKGGSKDPDPIVGDADILKWRGMDAQLETGTGKALISARLRNTGAGALDDQPREITVTLLKGKDGRVGSLRKDEQVNERIYRIDNGLLDFKVHQGKRQGKGRLRIAVAQEDGTVAAEEITYTVNGVTVITPTDGGAIVLTLRLLEQADGVTPVGTANNPLSDANPGIIEATLTTDATPDGEIVSFKSALGNIFPSSDLTDTSGVASSFITAGQEPGADSIIVTSTYVNPLTLEATTIQGAINFKTLGDEPTVTVPSPYTMSIAICNFGVNCLPTSTYGIIGNELEDADGDASVFIDIDDANAGPVDGILITYYLEDQIGQLTTNTTITDANGVADITLGPGSVAGGGVIRAVAEPTPGVILEEFATFETLGDSPGAPGPFVFSITSDPFCDAASPAACVRVGENATNPISYVAGLDGYLRVSLTDDAAAPVEGQRVDFSLETKVGSVLLASAVTDAAGLAEGIIGPGQTTGAGTAIAEVTPSPGITLTEEVSFATAGDAPDIRPYTVNVEVCNATIANGLPQDTCTPWGTLANPITVAQQGYAWATVENDSLVPQQDIVVNFSMENEFGVLETITALTDAGGQAYVGLRAGVDAGTGQVNANVLIDGTTYRGNLGFLTAGGGEPVPYEILVNVCSGTATSLDPTACTGNAVYGDSGNPLTSGTGNGVVNAQVRNFPITGVPATDNVVDTLVTFTLINDVGILLSTTGITNSDGIATVNLSPGDVAGAGIVVASANPDGNSPIEGSIAFASLGDAPPVAKPAVTVAVCSNAISGGACAATGEVGSEIDPLVPVYARATVLDAAGAPIQNMVVNFSLDNEVGALGTITALTDATGQAEVVLSAGETAGAGTVIASFSISGSDYDDSQGFLSQGGGQPVPYQILVDICDGVATGAACAGGPAAYGTSGLPLTSGTGNGVVNAWVADFPGGASQTDVLVTFTLSNDVGVLLSDTALTDGNGVASVNISPGAVAGAGVVTASANPDGNSPIDGFIGFASLGDAPAVAKPSVTVAVCSNAISAGACVAAGEIGTEIDPLVPVYARATVLDAAGAPIQNMVVNFELDNEVGSLGTITALTDATGQAEVVLSAGETAGAGTVIASFFLSGSDYEDSQGFVSQGGGEPTPFQITVNVCDGVATGAACAGGPAAYGTSALPLTSGTGNGVVNALVTDFPAGTAQVDVLVTFTLSNDVGVLLSDTALTDGNGIASVNIAPGAVAGAGIVVVNANPDGNSPIEDSIGFASLGDAPAIASPTVTVAVCSNAISAGACVAAGEVGSEIDPLVPVYARATVLDAAGAPIQNMVVNFELDNDVGALGTITALTDATGQAEVSLSAGEIAGAGTVIASFFLSGSDYDDSQGFLSQGGGEPVPFQISVDVCDGVATGAGCVGGPAAYGTSAAPLTSGTGNGVVNALVTDFPGGAVQVDVLVTFTLSNDVGVLLSDTALTDSNGIASVNVGPGAVAGAGVVTASANPDGNSPIQDSIGFASLGDAPAVAKPSVTVDVCSNAISSGACVAAGEVGTEIDPLVPVYARATVLDAAGAPIQNMVVNFELDNEVGALGTITALTDATGQAEVSLSAGETAGAGTVIASFFLSGTDYDDSQGFLSQGGGEPVPFQISVDVCDGVATGAGCVGGPAAYGTSALPLTSGTGNGVVNALVTDFPGGAVQVDVLVTFTLSNDVGVLLSDTALTDSNGIASVNVGPGAIAGAGVVTASANPDGNSPIEDSIGFASLGDAPAVAKPSVTVDVCSNAISSGACVAAGEVGTEIDPLVPVYARATVLDAAGAPIQNMVVNFELDNEVGALGTITALTDATGQAEVSLSAGETAGAGTVIASFFLSGTDYDDSQGFLSQGGGEPVPFQISVDVCDGVATGAGCVGGPAAYGTSALPLTSGTGNGVVNALITDFPGGAVQVDVLVTFTLSNDVGVLLSDTALTDSNGIASVNVGPGAIAGAGVVTASANPDGNSPIEDSIGFASLGDAPAVAKPTVTVAVCSNAISAGACVAAGEVGTEIDPLVPVYARATVLDAAGAPIQNMVVNFSLDNDIGALGTITALTDATGQAEVSLSAGETAGAGTVVASFFLSGSDYDDSQGFLSQGGGEPVPFQISVDVCDGVATGAGCVGGPAAYGTSALPLTSGTGNGVVNALVTDFPGGAVQVDVLVTFTLSNDVGVLLSDTALTDSNGIASVNVGPGAIAGAGVVTASANPDGNSPIEDSIGFASLGDAPAVATPTVTVAVCSNAISAGACVAAGEVGTEIDPLVPVYARATVLDAAGAPIQNMVVNFSLDNDVGALGTITALTDATGQAEVSLSAGETAGAGTVVASFFLSGSDYDDSQGFLSQGGGEPVPFQISVDVCDGVATGAGCVGGPAAYGTSALPLTSGTGNGTVNALVTDFPGGAVQVDVLVTFTLSNDVGVLLSDTALTDSNGIATVNLGPGAIAGAGVVTASANPDGNSPIEDSIGFASLGDAPAVATPTVTVAVCSNAISAGACVAAGEVGTEIDPLVPVYARATVLDAAGAPIQNMVVDFSLDNDVGALGTITALTDATGQAEVVLSAGETAGAGTVIASFFLNANDYEDSQGFLSQGGGEPVPFQISVDVCDGVATGAGCVGGPAAYGTSALPLTSGTGNGVVNALVTDFPGGAVQVDVLVTFTLTNDVGVLLSDTALTDSNGIASVNLAPGAVAGAGIVAANANPDGNSPIEASIGFASLGDAPAVASPTVTVAVCSNAISAGACVAAGEVGTEIDPLVPVYARATVLDAAGAPIQNMVVNFELDNDVGALGTITALTDATGQAEVVLSAGETAGAGTVIASFFLSGSDYDDSQGFLSQGGGEPTPFQITVNVCDGVATGAGCVGGPAAYGTSALPLTSGTGNGVVNALVTDFPGGAVQVDVLVTFSLSNDVGVLLSDTALTDSNGIASVNIGPGAVAGAGIVVANANPDGNSPIEASIGFASLGDAPAVATPTVTVAVCSNAISTGACVAAGEVGTEIDPLVPVYARATVLDAAGAPIQNMVVDFSLDNDVGALGTITALTDATGQAEVVLSAGETAGAGTVIASFFLNGNDYDDSQGFLSQGGGEPVPFQISVDVCDGVATGAGCVGGPAAYGTSALPLTSGTGNGVVNALVTDFPGGATQTDVLVTFTLSNDVGVLLSDTALTDSNGIASVNLAPGAVAGAGIVTASANPDGNSPIEASIGFASLGDAPAVATPTVTVAVCSNAISAGACVAAGEVGTEIDPLVPVYARATVLDAAGAPIQNMVVDFSLDNDVGALGTITALTDATGQAEVVLSAGETAGAGTVIASFFLSGNDYDDSQGFLSQGGGEPVPFQISVDVCDGVATGAGCVGGPAAYGTSALPLTSGTGNGVVNALVTDFPGGAVQVDVLVTFTLANDVGVLLSDTALTDSNGIASVNIGPGAVAGAGIVVANANPDGNSPIEASIGFASLGDAPAVATPTVTVAVCSNAISAGACVAAGEVGTEIDPLVPVYARATVLDAAGAPIQNMVVDFSLDNDVGALGTITALTDATGQAEVVLSAGETAGAGTVIASFFLNANDYEDSQGFLSQGGGEPVPFQISVDVCDGVATGAGCVGGPAAYGTSALPLTSGTGNGVVNALVTDFPGGAVQVDVLVTFTLSNDVGVLLSDTALTDSNGIASVNVGPGAIAGAGVVTASANPDGNSPIEDSIGFASLGDAPAVATPTVTVAVCSNAISAGACVAAGEVGTEIDPLVPVYARATALDAAGAPIQNMVVNFSLDNEVGALGTITALTDATGQAEVTLSAGETAGAGTVVASFTLNANNYEDSQGFLSQGGGEPVPFQISVDVCDGVATGAGCVGGPAAYGTSALPLTSGTGNGVVNALVTDFPGGAAQVDVLVTFTLSNDVGVLLSDTALTDSNGIASVNLAPGAIAGAGIVVANANPDGNSPIEDSIGFASLGDAPAVATPTVTVAVCSNAISAGACVAAGEVGSEIDPLVPVYARATVLDAAGAPVQNLVVDFSLDNDVGALGTITALTDATGQAEVVLSAGETAGAGTVIASAEVQGSNYNDKQGFLSQGGGEPVPFQISVDVCDGVATGAGCAGGPAAYGTSALPLTVGTGNGVVNALVTDFPGGAVQVDVLVTFSLANDIGVLLSTTALTDSNGIASVNLSAGDIAGAGIVEASANPDGNSPIEASIGFASLGDAPALPQPTVTVAVCSNAISAGACAATGEVGSEIDPLVPVYARATVLDAAGAPIQNLVVNFSLDNEVGALGTITALTDATGQAEVVLSAGQTAGAGTVVASATYQGDEYDDSQGFLSQGGGEPVPFQISVDVCDGVATGAGCAGGPAAYGTSALPLTSGTGNGVVNAWVGDFPGGVSQVDVLVTFSLANDVGVLLSTTALTDGNGVASVNLSPGDVAGAGIVVATANPDGNSPIEGEIGFASLGDAPAVPQPTVTVAVCSNDISAGACVAAGEVGSEIDPLVPVYARATVLNAAGAPIQNLVVDFSLENEVGALGTITALTDATGQAEVVLSAGQTAGAGTVVASAEVLSKTYSDDQGFLSQGGGEPVPFQISVDVCDGVATGAGCVGGPAAYGTSATPLTSGSGNGVVNAWVGDFPGGVSQVDVLVTFTLANDVGVLLSTTALTDSNGIASVNLSPGDVAGAGIVEATANPDGNSPIEAFIGFASLGDAPAVPQPTVTVAVCSNAISAGACAATGEVGSEIDPLVPVYARATVLNAAGAPIQNMVVNFSLDNEIGALGTITALTDATGQAEVVLSAGQTAGAGVVVASFSLSGTDYDDSVGFLSQGGGEPVPFQISVDVCDGVATGAGCVGGPSAYGTSATPLTSGTGNGVVNAWVADFPGGVSQTDVLVTFSLVNNVGVLLSSTALTDSNGIASVNLSPGDVTGAGIVQVSANPDGNSPIEASIGFASLGDAPAQAQPTVSVDVCSNAISAGACVAAGEVGTEIDPLVPVYARATVLNAAGAPIQNMVVDFSLDNEVGALGTITALTDATGQAEVVLSAGETGGAGTVVASFFLSGSTYEDSQGFLSQGGGEPVPFQISVDVCDGVATGAGCVGGPAAYGTSALPLTSGTGNGVVNALVTDFPGGVVQTDVLVTFSLANDVGVLLSTTALTDSNGIASVNIGPGDIAGAGIVVASANPDGNSPIEAEIGFASLGDALATPEPTVTVAVCSNAISAGACVAAGEVGTEIDPLVPVYARATVLDAAGAPVQNLVVNFSLDNDVGALGTITALTDATGQAEVVLSAGENAGAGAVIATATYQGSDYTDDQGFLSQGGGEPVPFQISVDVCDGVATGAGCAGGPAAYGTSALPLTSGTGNGVVNALVTDFPGGAVQTDVLVTFTLSNDVGVLLSDTALTDSNGIASVNIGPGDIAGAGVVTASANPDGNSPIDSSIGFASLGDAPAIANPTVAVDVCSNAISAGACVAAGEVGTEIDPLVPVYARATVLDAAGAPIQNLVVNFSLDNDVGALGTITALTDATGQAEVVLSAGENAGAGTVVATATYQGSDYSDDQGFLSQGGGEPVPFQISVDVCDGVATGAGCVGGPAAYGTSALPLTSGTGNGVVNALVTDFPGGAVQTDVLVTFTLSNDIGVLLSDTALTDSNGIASVNIGPGDIAGAGVVTASANPDGNSPIDASIGFASLGDAPALATPTVAVDVCSNAISAGACVAAGEVGTEIDPLVPVYARATVLDAAGAPIQNMVVNFSLDNDVGALGTITALTDATGQAEVSLSAGETAGAGTVVASFSLSGNDYDDSQGFLSQGGGEPVPFQIVVDVCDGVATGAGCVGGPAAYGTSALPLTSGTGNGVVNALVTDFPGGAVQTDVLVTFTLSNDVGVLLSDTALTDSNGIASVNIGPGDIAGAGVVTASANPDGNSPIDASIGFASLGDAPAVATPTVAVDVCSNAISAGACVAAGEVGTEIDPLVPVYARATVLDAAGAPIQNLVVNFELDNEVGALGTITALTDATGQAEVVLSAGENAGAGTVVATATYQGSDYSDDQGFLSQGGGEPVPFQISVDVCDGVATGAGCVGGPAAYGTSALPLTSGTGNGVVNALVTDFPGGAVQTDVLVTFTLSNDVGVLLSDTALTDSNGIASVNIGPGDIAGAGVVTASANPDGNSPIDASIGFASLGDAPAVATPTVAVDVCSNAISAGACVAAGEVGTEIDPLVPVYARATVLDAAGAPIQNMVVNFSLDNEVGALGTITALTDATGQAEVSLSAGENAGAGTVVASFTLNANNYDDSQGFLSQGGGEPVPFQIVVDVCDGVATGAGCVGGPAAYGTSALPLTSGTGNGVVNALVTDFPAGAVQTDVLVTFTLSNDVGVLLSDTALTDSNGIASVNIGPGDIAGAGIVTASANPDGNSPIETFIGFASLGDAPAVATPTVTVDVCSNDISSGACVAAGEVGTEIDPLVPVYARATVLDAAGAPIQSIVVNFSLENAVGSLGTITALTDATGQAEVSLSAGETAGAGTVVASFSLNGSDYDDSQGFLSQGGGEPVPFQITVDICDGIATGASCVGGPAAYGTSASPLTDGTGNGFVNALVTDFPGGAVQTDVLVTFTLSNDVGVLLSDTALTDSNGIAYVNIGPGDIAGAGIVTADANPDGNSPIDASIGFASLGDAPAVPDAYNITAEVCTLAVVVGGIADTCIQAGTSASPVDDATPAYAWATVEDAAAAPQADVLVFFQLATSVGTLIQTSALTDSFGQASVTLYAGNVQGAGAVVASADPDGSTPISDTATFQSDGDGSGTLQPYDLSVIICDASDDITCSGSNVYGTSLLPLTDGTGNGFVHAQVTDFPGGVAQQDVLVNFSLINSVGQLISTSAITNAAGLAIVQLSPGDVPGAGSVVATATPEAGITLSESRNYESLGDVVGAGDPYVVSVIICDASDDSTCSTSTQYGTQANPIVTGTPGFVHAHVEDDVAAPQVDALVTFSLSNAYGVLSQTVALTNAAGDAIVQLAASDSSGAGTVTADVDLGGSTYSGSINFATTVSPPTADTISLGVDWTDADICEDLDDNGAEDNPPYESLAIYVEDKGDAGSAITTACQVSGSNTFNANATLRELKTGVTATVKVHVYNETAVGFYTSPVEVTFSTLCAEIGKATIGSAAETTATVTSVGGVATTTYLADGCVGEDTITATATVGTVDLAAQVTFDIETPAVSSIEFVSAEPQVLALKGTGGAGRPETSVVTFRVVGTDGLPSANRDVYLGLVNAPGGVTLDTNAATSNADGLVEVTVSSGTVPGTLKVRARFDVNGDEPLTSDDIVVTSDQLSISSGLADQDGINIFATILNPEAWNYPNESVEITASLNDRTGEVVAIGTAVYFRAEMGRIGDGSGDAVCYTDVTGSCSVTWYSNGPEDTEWQHYDSVAGGGLDLLDNDCVPDVNNCFDRKGRAVIYAFAQGEETFVDLNGNNVFDTGAEDFTDLGEVYLDYNENGSRDLGDGINDYLEPYIEYDGDGVQDLPNDPSYLAEFYNGVTCSAASIAAGHCADLVNVYDSLTLAISTSTARIYLSDDPADLVYYNYTNGVDGIPNWDTGAPNTSYGYSIGETSMTLYGIITDQNGNSMPEGTTISASVDSTDSGWEIVGTSSYTVGSSTLETAVDFLVQFGDSGVSTGYVTVTVDTPKGNQTSQVYTISQGGSNCHSIHLAESDRTITEGVVTSVTVDVVIDQPVFGCDDDIVFDYFITGSVAGDHEFNSITNDTGDTVPVPPASGPNWGSFWLREADGYVATITIDVPDDVIIENEETLSIFIGNVDTDPSGGGATLGTNDSYILTITDDD